LATILSVQSSRAAISTSDSPSAANNTSLARITSRYGREYCPARRRSSRSSTSLILRGGAVTAHEVRHSHGNSFKPGRTYFRAPLLAAEQSRRIAQLERPLGKKTYELKIARKLLGDWE
jgi:hypothetical protein